MLAMVANDNACCLDKRGVLKSIASKLAPTVRKYASTQVRKYASTQKARRDNPGGLYFIVSDQQVQHISGMPLQLIIIGMLQSFIIFIIRAQQFFIMSMFMPAIGMILHIMQSSIRVHSITHFIDGVGMPIIGIGIIMFAIGMVMLAWDMHIMLMLPQCIIIGIPQFIIICIISALFLNMAMSMPAAGIILHIMPSSIMSQVMVAIIMGMPIIGIIGMLAFIGICICVAFIMVLFPEG